MEVHHTGIGRQYFSEKHQYFFREIFLNAALAVFVDNFGYGTLHLDVHKLPENRL